MILQSAAFVTICILFLFVSYMPNIPQEFVNLQTLDATILFEIRYFGMHNFVGTRIRGYDAPICYLTRPAAAQLVQVQQELLLQNLTLKIYDCYRPQQSVQHFVEWARDIADTKMRNEFYLHVNKSDLFAQGYIAERSGHTRGSTVDLTIVPLPVPAQETYKDGDALRPCYAEDRFRDNTLDMGCGFDCFDLKSTTLTKDVTPVQHNNRMILYNIMDKYGFENYEGEWWHYTLRKEPFTDKYFDFPIREESSSFWTWL